MSNNSRLNSNNEVKKPFEFSFKKPTSLSGKAQSCHDCSSLTNRRALTDVTLRQQRFSKNRRQSRFFQNKMKTKAQVSMEYLMIVGFAMLLLAPLLILYAQQTNRVTTTIKDAQSVKAADTIIDAVDSVYYMGEGAKRTIKIIMPKGVKSTSINENTLTLIIEGELDDYEINKWTSANMTGSIGTFEGPHNIIITHEGTNINLQDN